MFGQNIREMTRGCTTDWTLSVLLCKEKRGRTDFGVALHSVVYALRVGHVFQHHVAHLQRGLAKTELQQLDCSYLAISDGLSEFLERSPLLPHRSL